MKVKVKTELWASLGLLAALHGNLKPIELGIAIEEYVTRHKMELARATSAALKQQ